jgi:hypothetical protein
MMTGPEFDAALEAIADFIDLKSPYTLDHSRSVADLSGAAARVLSVPAEDCVAVGRAGLVHDLGWLGVPNSIWDKHGPLTRSEMERVRLHRICPSGCCPRRTPSLRSRRLPSSTTNGWTDQVIRGSQPSIHQRAGRVLGAADCYVVSSATTTPSAAGTAGGTPRR